MLYEFLPPEDQRVVEERILHHVILKADVRDSSILTRSLMEKGMNAASYFSLNFYEPVTSCWQNTTPARSSWKAMPSSWCCKNAKGKPCWP